MIDQIRKFNYAQPFEPFMIELSSGTSLLVPTPDHIALTEHEGGRVAVLADDSTFDIVSANPFMPDCCLISAPGSADRLGSSKLL